MPRLLRTTLDDGIFHVTGRGVDRCTIYRDSEDFRTFATLLARAIRTYRWDPYVVCLMTNHFHLVIDTTVEAMSRGIQWLDGLYAQLFNHRWGRTGHLFGERFRSKPIEDEEHLVETVRYVLANPVRAGLCESPEDWPWSGSKWGRAVT